jgi:hypothetical protein
MPVWLVPTIILVGLLVGGAWAGIILIKLFDRDC